MSRQKAEFRQVLAYFNQPGKACGLPVLHNLKTKQDDLVAIEQEFKENARYLPTRKNGVALYHEILSLSIADKTQVTTDILEDLAREYLAKRAPATLAYAKVHLDTKAPHIHILIAANQFRSSQKLRLTKAAFGKIKREIETLQKERYPFLSHSLAQTVMPQKTVANPKKKWQEDERTRRLAKQKQPQPSKKETITEQLQTCLRSSHSEAQFLIALTAIDLKIYVRGNTVGVLQVSTGNKHRLATLGLTEEYVQAHERWQRLPGRTQELAKLEQTKMHEQVMEVGFREEVQEVLANQTKADRHRWILQREQGGRRR